MENTFKRGKQSTESHKENQLYSVYRFKGHRYKVSHAHLATVNMKRANSEGNRGFKREMTLRGGPLGKSGSTEILDAGTQPGLGGVPDDAKRGDGRVGLGRRWGFFLPVLAERCSRCLIPPLPHLSLPSPGAAPAPLVGLHGGRGRSRAVSRNAPRRRRRWPWRRPLSSSGRRDSGPRARSYSAVSRPAPQASRRPPPQSPDEALPGPRRGPPGPERPSPACRH